ncbi:MAG: hypothetical protein KGL67_01790 [Patescibacteria group bacterium]|nr:hypothetical protein [Patescibacteria group bacterium]
MIQFSKKIIIIFLFFFIFLNFSHTSAVENITPTITLFPTIYYAGDEVLHIEGRAQPSSNVEIVFNSIDWAPKSFTVGSDASGKWVFLQRLYLEEGRWEVKARNTIDTTSQSVWSDSADFISVPTVFVFAGIKIKFSTLNVLLIASLASFVLIIILSIFRFKSVQKEVRAFRLGSTERLIKGRIDDVRRDITEELWRLEKKLKQSGSFTPEEAEHREKLLVELRKYEKEMEEDIMGVL